MNTAKVYVLSIILALISGACNQAKEEGSKQVQKSAPKVDGPAARNTQNQQASKGNTPARTTTKTAPANSPTAVGLGSAEAVVRALPLAILNEASFARLLPTQTLLESAMRCTGTHPLVKLVTDARSGLAKNISSSRKRVGLGTVVYDGFEVKRTRTIASGEVDKNCTALKDIEVQSLKMRLKFIAPNGAGKVTPGKIDVIRLGRDGWFVLRM